MMALALFLHPLPVGAFSSLRQGCQAAALEEQEVWEVQGAEAGLGPLQALLSLLPVLQQEGPQAPAAPMEVQVVLVAQEQQQLQACLASTGPSPVTCCTP